MKKILPILMITTFISVRLFGQSLPEKLDKLKNDANTKYNAAKADSFIISKKIISADTIKATNIVSIKRRGKGCNRTSKNKSGQL